MDIGEISNKFFADVLIIPANSAFVIWGIIYLGLMILAVYQFLPSNSQKTAYLGYFLALASLAQIIWLICFQYLWFAASIIPMLVILLALILLYLRLPEKSARVSWLIHQPISIYLAWISVATIVNIASVLAYNNWSGWGITPGIWTVIMMAVGTILGVIACLHKSDFAFPAVIIWAIFWIGLANQSLTLVFNFALAFVLILAALIGWRSWQRL